MHTFLSPGCTTIEACGCVKLDVETIVGVVCDRGGAVWITEEDSRSVLREEIREGGWGRGRSCWTGTSGGG